MTNGNRGRDEHRTICAFDIAGFGGVERTRTNHVALREGMYLAVEKAFGESDIPWADCYEEGSGDGILTLAPATVGKSTFAANLPAALVAALGAHNAAHPPEERLRMRMALHAGEVARDGRGVTGPAVIHTFRLLDSDPIKEALRESTGVLAIIASNWFYEDVISQRPEYAPTEYVRTGVLVKETNGIGWIRLPDGVRHAPEPVAGPHEVTKVRSTVALPDESPVVVMAPVMLPATPKFYQVVEAIEAIPCMQGEYTRSMVIDHLVFAGAVRYFPNRRAHVTSILRTCLDFEDGVVQLVTAISGQEPSGSLPVKRLVALLTDG